MGSLPFEENLTLKNFFWFYVFLKYYVNQVKVWVPEGALFLGASGIFQSLTERISPSPPPGLLQTPVRGCVCHPLATAGFQSIQPARAPERCRPRHHSREPAHRQASLRDPGEVHVLGDPDGGRSQGPSSRSSPSVHPAPCFSAWFTPAF